MPASTPDRTGIRSRPAPGGPRLARPRDPVGGAPLAGAPGWHVVRRKPRSLVLRERLLRRHRRFAVLAIAGVAGLAVLAVLLVRPYWGEAETERSPAGSTAPVASSQGARSDEPATASAEAPPTSPAPAAVGAGEGSGGQQDASANGATRPKADPSPPQDPDALLADEGSVALTPQVQSQLPPTPVPAQSGSPQSDTSSREQLPEPASPERSPSSPQRAASAAAPAATAIAQGRPGETSSAPDLPAEPASTPTSKVPGAAPSSPNFAVEPAPTAQAGGEAPPRDRPAEPEPTPTAQAGGEAFPAADRPAAPAAEIRVFIHHFAGRGADAALAERLAGHLRGQGFTVADIRPVDFSIGTASVRYFFADDRDASEQLVDELGRFMAEAGAPAPDQASDFTHFTPKPRPGNVEVWLPAS